MLGVGNRPVATAAPPLVTVLELVEVTSITDSSQGIASKANKLKAFIHITHNPHPLVPQQR